MSEAISNLNITGTETKGRALIHLIKMDNRNQSEGGPGEIQRADQEGNARNNAPCQYLNAYNPIRAGSSTPPPVTTTQAQAF